MSFFFGRFWIIGGDPNVFVVAHKVGHSERNTPLELVFFFLSIGVLQIRFSLGGDRSIFSAGTRRESVTFVAGRVLGAVVL